MNKNEARQAMHEGKKVTHKFFAPYEWVSIQDGYLILEDGVKCSEEEFWKWRTNYWWDTDWEIFKG